MPPVRRAPFKQVDRHFNAQYVARPADSQKKRLSTREPYAKPAVTAATSVSPYKRDAAREAGQKALQSLAAAQKRVQKTLRPNMAARRVNVPDPAGLRSPSAMFPSEDLPVTVKQMQDVVENAKGRCPKEQLDRMVGDHIASLLPPLGVTTTVCLASMQAVHELGKAPRNNVVRQPSKSTYYPTRLKRGGRAVTAAQHPVVFMDELQGIYINNIAPGRHGYAYMSSSDCAGLHDMGPFHLFNHPIHGHSSPVRGGEVVNRRWRYCGVYVAHKTPVFLSEEGWRRIPDETKRMIAQNFCQIAACDAGQSSGSCSPEKIDTFLYELNRGVLKLPLMLFRCVGFPIEYANAVGMQDVHQSHMVGRVPSKRQIDFGALRQAQALDKVADEAKMGQGSAQEPIDREAQKRDWAQERERRQAQEAKRKAREEEERRANTKRNQMLRKYRILGPNRRAPAPGPQ
ncbi:hypothetical protein ONZ51_g12089 [Trametes cubensis]|uniref:DUF6697 domain-containing protein n=1 Tax=Trametes cubensis TaxID=1111947 RepID=A0AAD7TGV6_9APHY|nr:hypothetical protein ONZ51_g12089 [Trametes cubensis]